MQTGRQAYILAGIHTYIQANRKPDTYTYTHTHTLTGHTVRHPYTHAYIHADIHT